MDLRLEQAPEVEAFVRALRCAAVGLYFAGSLASGDYRPRISDIDAVVLLQHAPFREERRRLMAVHRALVAQDDRAHAIHCAYVARDDASDRERKHWTWAFGELFRRRVGGIARAELLADPVVTFGPPPSSWLPPMGESDLREAARAEIAGYWLHAVRRRGIWQQDVYVDLGLTVWARAEAAIVGGALITKGEAIERLRVAALPGWIVDDVAGRRDGAKVTLTPALRAERAAFVRGFLKEELARLVRSA